MSDTPKSWGAAGVSVEFHRGETWKERAEALSERLSFAEARIRELEAVVLAEWEAWRAKSIDTWHAMQAMRNTINEHAPMPSLESDLLRGPETSVFCAVVAESVVSRICELKSALDRLVGDDGAVGWRGQNASSSDHFACEFCGQEHLDFSKIDHQESCLVVQARDALRARTQADAPAQPEGSAS